MAEDVFENLRESSSSTGQMMGRGWNGWSWIRSGEETGLCGPFLGKHWLTAILLGGGATVTIGGLAYGSERPDVRTCVLLVTYWLVIIFPLAYGVKTYKKYKDLFHPSFVGCATFLIFHLLFNPLVLSNARVLSIRKTDETVKYTLESVALKTHALLFVAWLAYLGGHSLMRQPVRSMGSLRRISTPTYLLVGTAFVAAGLVGNAESLGGAGPYLSKMWKFYEKWDVYERAMVSGGTEWSILMRFLPLGLLILAYGFCLRAKNSRGVVVASLVGASIANVFLSSASGGRGIMLTTAIYSIILINRSVRRLGIRSIGVVIAGLLLIVVWLGSMRATVYFEGEATSASMFNSGYTWVRFGALYLTNYLGTLDLVAEVERSGIVYGATAFAGVKGLLGGPTPVTTEREIWWRRTGSYVGSNPRYGAPGELFFNFGWAGVIVGMILIGLLVRILAAAYDSVVGERSVMAAMVTVYAAFTANFVIIGNLSYLPPYFTYYSMPFYLGFLIFRERKC